MSIDHYIAFVTMTILFQVSPGPAVILAINNGVKYGLKRTTVAIMGNVVALSILVAISSAGLGAVLSTSEYLFKILKFVGALYLIYLGIKIWFSPVTKILNGVSENRIEGKPSTLFSQAFFITLFSPKALVYVSALLPQFINTENNLFSQIIILGFTISLIQFLVFMSYATLSSRARHWFENSRKRNLFNKFSGLTFIGFGVALATSTNKT